MTSDFDRASQFARPPLTWNSAGRDYYERKLAAGKTRKEALRCLKRRLSDVVFRQLVIDLQPAATAPNTITS